jgi:hypothetical protein
VGIPAALALGRFISAQLYGVKENDPRVAGMAVILLSLNSSDGRVGSGSAGQPHRPASRAALRMISGLTAVFRCLLPGITSVRAG